MDPIPWKVSPVIDAHTHYRGQEPIPHYLDNVNMANHARGVILVWLGEPLETGERLFQSGGEGASKTIFGIDSPLITADSPWSV